jgi:hypothetical protein
VLHHIITGEIPIRKEHFERIKSSKRLNFLQQHFRNKDNYKRLLTSTVQEQKNVLRQIGTYHQLLYNLFHNHHYDKE